MHFYIFNFYVDGSRYIVSSLLCSFLFPGHTTYVSIVYLRLVISVSFKLSVATAFFRRLTV